MADFKTVTDAMEATGTPCPSEARKALTAENKRLGIRGHYQYKPHVGAKQREKVARRAARAAGLPDVSVS